MYVDLILYELSQSADFNVPTRAEARTLLEKFLRYETVLTAVVFSRIFEITSPISEYLQTNGFDLLQAWRLVESTVRLEKISRDFSTVITCASNFVKNINEQLSDLDVDILIDLDVDILIDLDVDILIDLDVDILIDLDVDILIDLDVDILIDLDVDILIDLDVDILIDLDVDILRGSATAV